jgi:hypothetical protein
MEIVCDEVMDRIKNYCFGCTIYQDSRVVSALESSIPIMFSRISGCNILNIKEIFNDLNKILLPYYGDDIFALDKSDEKRLCFEVTFLLLLGAIQRQETSDLMFFEKEAFIEAYPEFRNEVEAELLKLMEFRNAMKLALLLVQPRGRKGQLMHLATRISEGRRAYTNHQGYVTGSSQSKATKNRVLIYEREGGVKAEHRTSRKRRSFSELEERDNLSEVSARSSVRSSRTI